MWKYKFAVSECGHQFDLDIFADDIFSAYEQIIESSDRIEGYQLLSKEKVEV